MKRFEERSPTFQRRAGKVENGIAILYVLIFAVAVFAIVVGFVAAVVQRLI